MKKLRKILNTENVRSRILTEDSIQESCLLPTAFVSKALTALTKHGVYVDSIAFAGKDALLVTSERAQASPACFDLLDLNIEEGDIVEGYEEPQKDETPTPPAPKPRGFAVRGHDIVLMPQMQVIATFDQTMDAPSVVRFATRLGLEIVS